MLFIYESLRAASYIQQWKHACSSTVQFCYSCDYSKYRWILHKYFRKNYNNKFVHSWCCIQIGKNVSFCLLLLLLNTSTNEFKFDPEFPLEGSRKRSSLEKFCHSRNYCRSLKEEWRYPKCRKAILFFLTWLDDRLTQWQQFRRLTKIVSLLTLHIELFKEQITFLHFRLWKESSVVWTFVAMIWSLRSFL